MLISTPHQDILAIGRFLADSGYDTAHLSAELELVDGLFANEENLQPLLLKTAGDGLLPVLARLFFIGLPVAEARCQRVIPASILNIAMQCGLLRRIGDSLEAPASLLPFRDRLICCDSTRSRAGNPDMVLGPGVATQFMARLAVGGEAETTLDVGSGTGVLAVEAAAYSSHVTGTDINARSLQFAEFTAAINGVANAEFLCGDGFTPVHGRRFSRIIANPPFFLSPAKKFTYCDSPLELDGFTGRLAAECSAYLEDGGYFQMICQWAEVEGQRWEQRLRDWTADSGCDVLVLLAPRSSAIAYAELRDKEARQTHGDSPEYDFASRVGYLRERGVKSILSGVITMRKRPGANWFTVLGTAPAGERVGPGIRQRFETLTLLATSSEAQIFEMRFRLASDVLLETVASPGPAGWLTTSIHLVKSEALVDRLRLDEAVAGCLVFFDGQRTLREIAQAVAERLGLSSEEARRRCFQLVRRLLQSSYVVAVKPRSGINHKVAKLHPTD
jgi:SAM-dependent methyltransferase